MRREGRQLIRKCLMRSARNWRMWMLLVLKEREVVRIKRRSYFVYEVKLSEATRINERMLLDWQRSWSKAEGRLGDVEVTSSAEC